MPFNRIVYIILMIKFLFSFRTIQYIDIPVLFALKLASQVDINIVK